MALSTDKAPVYGGSTLVIEFPEETPLSSDAEYFMIYEGSQQRHVTTARILAKNKLHSIIPGHNEAETVQLSVQCNHDDDQSVLVTHQFQYVTDGVFYLAQFLVDSVYNPASLEDLELIKSDHFDLADEDISTLDQRLSRALAYLDFPDWWSLLGSDAEVAEPESRETLLHFAARLGLNRVAVFLIRKPGSHVALKLTNRNGDLPRDVALANNQQGLAELLSDYNSHSLMPLGRWFETEKGVIQTQETGDVTLTSKLQNHHRSVVEDIIVLQGVQRGLEEENINPSIPWQAVWPSADSSDTNNAHPAASDETFETICKKTAQLSEIVTLEKVNDHLDNSDNDPNTDTPQDDVDMSEDCDVAMETKPLPRLHVSEGEEEEELAIMEDSISTLHEYIDEHLLRIREKSTVFNKILEQDLRKENLARFSTSCPALDIESRISPLPSIDEADLCKSMVDLVEDNESQTVTSPVSRSGDLYSSGADIPDGHEGRDVHIVVDATTGESSTDFSLQSEEYDKFLSDYYGGNIPQVRRRSFSPPPQTTRVTAGETTAVSQLAPVPGMLLQDNKSSNLSPSEGDETDEESFRDKPEDHMPPPKAVITDKRAVRSVSDIDDMSIEEQDTIQDASDREESPDQKGSYTGRGPGDRYSADIEQMMWQTKEHHSGSSLDKMGVPLGGRNGGEGQNAGLNVPHAKITKALSTSSIPMATNNDRPRGGMFKGQSQDSSKQMSAPSHMLIQKLIAEHDEEVEPSESAQFCRQARVEEGEPSPQAGIQGGWNGGGEGTHQPPVTLRSRPKGGLTIYDFLNDPTNFSQGNTSSSPKTKEKEKEDKKRKTSVFSRFHSSYRTKKNKEKEGKNKSSHRFVSVSFSNATTCDVCNKQLTNKPAVKCQICLVNVHEHSCKEQIAPCDKFKHKSHPPRQTSADAADPTRPDKTGMSMSVSNLRPSYSFKEKPTRPQSAYVGASTQPIPTPPVQAEVQPDLSGVRKRNKALQSPSAQAQRRSLPTPRITIDSSYLDTKPSRSPSTSPNRLSQSAKSNRAIAEEGEIIESSVSRLALGQSNIANSHSTESLDEVDSVQEVRYDDVELGNLEVDEPETWSETVEKKALKKMPPKDVKRQDTIWELIQTERQYCKRLKTLQIFFRDGMLRELNMSSALVEKVFPQLDDLIYIHMSFLRQLQELQGRRTDRSVEELGPALIEQFSGESARHMKIAYGVFCSGHLEAVQLYKDQFAKDRKFQAFIKQRTNHPLCKKREVPDYILLITQRCTKYPILIDSVIKNTKDKRDRECLLKALELSKDVLHCVDQQVAAAERQMKLRDIHQRLDPRSYASLGDKKIFGKMDIFSKDRRLLHEGQVGWKTARGKVVEVLGVVLTDVLIFLQDKDQKLTFFSQDNKYCVISLFKLLVREKRDSRETKGMYLISQNKSAPEMYEIVFNSTAETQRWAKVLREAVEKCPEQEEESPSLENEEEKRRSEERVANAQRIMDCLHAKDEEIRKCCDDKNRLIVELLAVYNDMEESHSRPGSLDFEESAPSGNAGALQAAIQEVSQTASALTSMLHDPGTNLSRSVSSVGEHSSNTFPAVPKPKRPETFSGFDSNHEGPRVPVRPRDPEAADMSDSGQSMNISEPDLSQDGDISTSSKRSDGETDSGCALSVSGVSTTSTVSPMSTVSALQEQTNIVHFLRTLHSIVHLTTSQNTAVETLRAQLAEANERINKLSVEVHERKSGYKHNQLEELRNLQGVIQKEKEEWERKKDNETYGIEQDKIHMDEMRKELKAQEAELQQQREELKQKREVLQKQMDLQREKAQISQLPSSSSLGAGSSGGGSGADVADFMRKPSPASGFVPGHRRSASAESFPSSQEQTEGHRSHTSKDTGHSEPHKSSMTKLQSFSYGNKANVPVHLLSAKNEQKMGSKNVQQLPSKLLSNSALSSDTVSSTKQANSQTSAARNSPVGHAGQGQLSGNYSSPALTDDSASQGDGQLGHSASVGQLGHHGNAASSAGSNVVIPKGGWQSNRPKQQGGLAGISGLMKLAEKTDKKGKGSPSSSQSGAEKGAHTTPSPSEKEKSQQRPKSGNRDTKYNHKSQKSDSDVIYF